MIADYVSKQDAIVKKMKKFRLNFLSPDRWELDQ